MPRSRRRNLGGPQRVEKVEETRQEDREASPNDGEVDQAAEDKEKDSRGSADSPPPVLFPIFCLAKPDDEYWAKFIECFSKFSIKWAVIKTNSPSKDEVLADINNGNNYRVGPYPFLHATHGDVEDHYVSVLRAAGDSRDWEPFTKFTWLIIDEECVENSSDPKIVVCTYAPDYAPDLSDMYEDDAYEDENDPEPVLKTLTIDLFHAFGSLEMLETLVATPSETFRSWENGKALSSMPPFITKYDPELGDDKSNVATPAEAQWAKRRALRTRPTKMEDTVRDEKRGSAVLYWSSMLSVLRHGELLSSTDSLARWNEATVSFVDNRLKRPEDEDVDPSKPDQRDFFHIARMMQWRGDVEKSDKDMTRNQW